MVSATCALINHSIVSKIWALAEDRNIWITVYNILRKENFDADAELLKNQTDLELRINQKTFPKSPSNTTQKMKFST